MSYGIACYTDYDTDGDIDIGTVMAYGIDTDIDYDTDYGINYGINTDIASGMDYAIDVLFTVSYAAYDAGKCLYSIDEMHSMDGIHGIHGIHTWAPSELYDVSTRV